MVGQVVTSPAVRHRRLRLSLVKGKFPVATNGTMLTEAHDSRRMGLRSRMFSQMWTQLMRGRAGLVNGADNVAIRHNT